MAQSKVAPGAPEFHGNSSRLSLHSGSPCILGKNVNHASELRVRRNLRAHNLLNANLSSQIPPRASLLRLIDIFSQNARIASIWDNRLEFPWNSGAPGATLDCANTYKFLELSGLYQLQGFRIQSNARFQGSFTERGPRPNPRQKWNLFLPPDSRQTWDPFLPPDSSRTFEPKTAPDSRQTWDPFCARFRRQSLDRFHGFVS